MVGDKELDTGFRCWSCKEFTTLRARIAELEQDLAYFPSTVRSLAETVTEREAEINQLRAELAAIKAQEPVAYDVYDDDSDQLAHTVRADDAKRVAHYRASPGAWRMAPLYAAPVSEAKAQGVIDFVFSGELPNATFVEVEDGNGNSINVGEWFKRDDGYSVLRLNAAPVQQVSVPGGWRVERGYSPSGYVLHSPSGSMIRVCDSGGGGIETAFALFLKAMLAALQPSQGKAP